MTINPDLQAGGGGGGTNGASRQKTPPHVDLELEAEGREGETGASRQTTPPHVDLESEGEEGETGSEIPTGGGESLQQLGLRTAVEKLERMCSVLGVDYQKKLLEMGVISVEDLDVSRVLDQVDFLQDTIDANYAKLQTIGRDLFREWELSGTPFKRMMEFAHVISVSDSITSSEVVDKDFLSTKWLIRAKKELDGLRTVRIKEGKKEYEQQKKILKEMVFENHLTWESVEFDPTKKVNAEQHVQETTNIRKSIEKAKALASGRKQLVFRVELVRQLIERNELPINTIRGFLKLAQKHVEEITVDVPIMYDGDNVSALLDKFKLELDALEEEEQKQVEKNLRMQTTRTRYGRSPAPDAPQDSSDDEADA